MLYQMLSVSHPYRPPLSVPTANIYISLPEGFFWPPKLTLSARRKQVRSVKELALHQEQPSNNDCQELVCKHPCSLVSQMLLCWRHVLYCQLHTYANMTCHNRVHISQSPLWISAAVFTSRLSSSLPTVTWMFQNPASTMQMRTMFQLTEEE